MSNRYWASKDLNRNIYISEIYNLSEQDAKTLHTEVTAIIAEMENQANTGHRHEHKLRIAYAVLAEAARRLGLTVPPKGLGVIDRMFKQYSNQAFDEGLREEFGDQVIDRIRREAEEIAFDTLEDWVRNQSEVGLAAFEKFKCNYDRTNQP